MEKIEEEDTKSQETISRGKLAIVEEEGEK